MTLSLFTALFIFAGISAFTPGPNNTLLMASGLTHGFRRTWPLIVGVCVGFPFMIACVGLGLGQVFQVFPVLYTVLKFAGAAYMLWLAWKIASAQPSDKAAASAAVPLSFLQGAAFQWVNPKGWIMAITALATYTQPENYYVGVAAVVGVFVFMGLTSASTWAMFGVALKNLLQDPRWFRVINVGLAVLLVLSLVPMLWH